MHVNLADEVIGNAIAGIEVTDQQLVELLGALVVMAGVLLAAAEKVARKSGVACLFTEASELARPVFERAGYSVLHRRDFIIVHAGADVAIHNYAMEKRLR